MDYFQTAKLYPRGDDQSRKIRIGHGERAGDGFCLGRFLRLVYRAFQARPLRGGRGAETFGAVGALFRIGERVEAVASVYSVRDGGDLSEPAGDGGEHHGFIVPAV